jgi:hypothetical protein
MRQVLKFKAGSIQIRKMEEDNQAGGKERGSLSERLAICGVSYQAALSGLIASSSSTPARKHLTWTLPCNYFPVQY